MNLSEDILFYAFRYALGRDTGAVFTVSRAIIINADEILPGSRAQMVREIESAIKRGDAGILESVAYWKKVADALNERTNTP